MQPALIIAGFLSVVFSCLGAANWLRSFKYSQIKDEERFVLAFPVGAAMVSLAVFVLACLGLLYWPVLVALTLFCLAGYPFSQAWRRLGKTSRIRDRAGWE